LPVCEHLAAGHRRHATPRHRLGARRQQHLGLYADPVYDGANLARTANAVIVTVNYRLGVMGFFNLGQLKTGDAHDDSGNFALLDIIKALQFVNRNIASFGGNPGNVTLMGESAGAVNVFAVMTSPPLVQAKPALVHRLLPMSGGFRRPANCLPAACRRSRRHRRSALRPTFS
jgi:Carboxylesterase type B